MKFQSLPALIATTAAMLPFTSQATNYDEATNGALSNNHMVPTVVAVTPGLNSIAGEIGAVDYDFATVTVPSGYAMTSLTLDSFVNNGGASFFAIAPGTSSPIVPYGNDAVGLLGWVMVRPSSVGPNLLPFIGTSGSGATGFSGPLPAGSYTFWMQDYSENITYKFSFLLEATVPPVITVTSKKLSKTKATLTGTASGTGTTVSYRVGKKGAFKKAKGPGTSPWTVVASGLKPGKNIVTVQAKGLFGTSSTKVTIKVKE